MKALAEFEAWQKSHPRDPLGSVSEAAAYLFEECYRQGVLTSEFFLDDKRFLGKAPLKPDPELRAALFAADKQAQALAQLRLKTNPNAVGLDTSSCASTRIGTAVAQQRLCTA